MSNRPKNVAIHPYNVFYPTGEYHRNIVKLAKRKAPFGYNIRRIGTKSFKKLLMLLKIK